MPHSWIFGSKPWQLDIKDLLKQMYTNIRNNQIANPSTPPVAATLNKCISTAALRKSVHWKKSNTKEEEEPSSIAGSSSSLVVIQYQTVATQLQNAELPTCYISNAPYYKEGMVSRKHLLENKDQKAKHRDWKVCFMVIEGSQLRVYKLDSTSCGRRSLSRSCSFSSAESVSSSMSSSARISALDGGDWMSSALYWVSLISNILWLMHFLLLIAHNVHMPLHWNKLMEPYMSFKLDLLLKFKNLSIVSIKMLLVKVKGFLLVVLALWNMGGVFVFLITNAKR